MIFSRSYVCTKSSDFAGSHYFEMAFQKYLSYNAVIIAKRDPLSALQCLKALLRFGQRGFYCMRRIVCCCCKKYEKRNGSKTNYFFCLYKGLLF